MSLNLEKASFKDFENMEGKSPFEWAEAFDRYVQNWSGRGHWNYYQEGVSGCMPEVELNLPGQPRTRFVSLVSNDYLGFTQHPAVKAAAIAGIEKYGAGSAASPAIGGHMGYHRQIEDKIARFFRHESAMLYTTGYTANSATMQALLKREDLAILDMAVHASMYEGCQLTNVKVFPHNNMEKLERILSDSQGHYRTRMVIVDGVYSQPGDIAKLDEVVKLAKHYGAYVAMDDAHGVGVVGNTGRGAIELYDLFGWVDIITGTFSKTFGHLGGYVVADPKLVGFLKFQARQHIFSVAMTPASCCILKSVDLIDEEPWWKERLWTNINYLRTGLLTMGFDLGNTQSAIIPVMTGDPNLNAEACSLLLQAGIYANQIGYPAVPRKNARIRMSITAAHTLEHMDKILNAWDWVGRKLNLNKYPIKT
ncbi:aminotransferase class I/II-fold pyridoxal phosphate-dependent enzyme [Mucilaginibacter ginsenosidivorans]|uniref:Aminotransferase class I/II-fold pyridoxal phosphate-dependent enzyme n=1 Tax=Mucilaginibacter ginsenosidivorans TaxID=398053 RepID=A0A5B8UVT1_9SPHI|nr:aminotransferase class I/II-fold pyridoxal phosphate-dependent enzyme [Mucilaginibacter ginsenosidivorans]QEC62441.1 aminotransferase class I/II-fold pyridoxal phosphate-dependent enzyme [Mucilaginibacter ginsenosidivorans]